LVALDKGMHEDTDQNPALRAFAECRPLEFRRFKNVYGSEIGDRVLENIVIDHRVAASRTL
jgi:hypothetical protein